MMVLLVGLLGVLATVVLHVVVSSWLIVRLHHCSPRWPDRSGNVWSSLVLGTAACALAIKHALDILIWAVLYWSLIEDQFGSFEESLYFSSAVYTTVGFGDVVIDGRWRLLSSFEAISGMILFGLSTALLFAIIQALWTRQASHRES